METYGNNPHQVSYPRTSLVVQWLRLRASNTEVMGSILVGELRSHMPCGMAKKKE